MAKTLTGQCFCGAVKYRLTARPMFVHCCHCTDCQRQTGSAFVLNAIIEARHVKSRGKTEVVTLPTDSGRPHDVTRCPKCETALWSDYGRRGVMLFVRVGTLDTPAALPPDVHIFTRSKLPWVALPKGVPAFKVYYSMKKLWPAASLKRRAALGI
ncbi:MAG: GFA family protein [Rhizomicrobium sp.]